MGSASPRNAGTIIVVAPSTPASSPPCSFSSRYPAILLAARSPTVRVAVVLSARGCGRRPGRGPPRCPWPRRPGRRPSGAARAKAKVTAQGVRPRPGAAVVAPLLTVGDVGLRTRSSRGEEAEGGAALEEEEAAGRSTAPWRSEPRRLHTMERRASGRGGEEDVGRRRSSGGASRTARGGRRLARAAGSSAAELGSLTASVSSGSSPCVLCSRE